MKRIWTFLTFVFFFSVAAGGDAQAMALKDSAFDAARFDQDTARVFSFTGQKNRFDDGWDNRKNDRRDDGRDHKDFRGDDFLVGFSGLFHKRHDQRHRFLREVIFHAHRHGNHHGCHAHHHCRPDAPTPVPLPAALPLFGLGLAGLGFAGYVSRKKP